MRSGSGRSGRRDATRRRLTYAAVESFTPHARPTRTLLSGLGRFGFGGFVFVRCMQLELRPPQQTLADTVGWLVEGGRVEAA